MAEKQLQGQRQLVDGETCPGSSRRDPEEGGREDEQTPGEGRDCERDPAPEQLSLKVQGEKAKAEKKAEEVGSIKKESQPGFNRKAAKVCLASELCICEAYARYWGRYCRRCNVFSSSLRAGSSKPPRTETRSALKLLP